MNSVRCGFAGVFGFDKGFQVVETPGPENAVFVDPGIDGAQRFGIEMINAIAAFPVFPDEMSATKQTQMFGNRWTGNGKSAGDLSGGLAAPTEQVEDSATGGIGESVESGFGGICNCTVTHIA